MSLFDALTRFWCGLEVPNSIYFHSPVEFIDRHSVDSQFNLRPEVKDVNVVPRLNLYIFYSH